MAFFPVRCAALLALLLFLGFIPQKLHAACGACASFEDGAALGTVSINALTEASGIASSRRNLGVLWTHNDGSSGNIYAISTNGSRLATFRLNAPIEDLEDIAVGPGPVSGVNYLYAGDIGGNVSDSTVRQEIKILRVAEPAVDLRWAANPRSVDFENVQSFTLVYPEGSYDAETLMIDPLTADVLVATKEASSTGLYRANLNDAPNGGRRTLEFIGRLSFSQPSAGDISPSGKEIILRRENFAMLWERCNGEAVSNALARAGQIVPVMGPPIEPNGEGLAFLADGSGYVTISESNNPSIFFFAANCPRAPEWILEPADRSGFVAGSVQFESHAAGYPAPVYTWRFGAQLLSGATNASLLLTNLSTAQAGTYHVTASNIHGVVTSTAELTVRSLPDLRITEVMSDPASSPGVQSADWWELTSFENEPVNLSGWRFNDNSGGLTDPYIIGGFSIDPGESVIFVDTITPASFVTWWGSTNLPPNLKIVTYSGGGLGLGASGDSIRLWDSSTVEVTNTVASVNFGSASAGVSFNYNPATGAFGSPSQLGVNGVIRAARTTDLGSPGRIRALVSPRLTGVANGTEFRIEFDALAGNRYVLQVRSDFAGATWNDTGDTFQATVTTRAAFSKQQVSGSRFYRVRVE